MVRFEMDRRDEQGFSFSVEEVEQYDSSVVRTLVEIDLQTFAESTFSPYTAAVLLRIGRVYVLKADDAVIGTCVCMRSWERPNEAHILSMGIRPGWRGQGLGQRFVQAVLQFIRNRGVRSVSLLVGADNRRAIRVYTDVGFETVGHQDGYGDGDLVIMRAQLQIADQAQLIELPRKE